MSLIDIGVNFHSSQLRHLSDALLLRAQQAGVGAVFATGTSLVSSLDAVALAGAHEQVWATAGVHPHAASEFSAQDERDLEALWAHPKVVAIGECGLDYNRMISTRLEQRHAFERQLQASLPRGKPLFLHCRDAFDDFFAMVRDARAGGASGVVHCFTGTADEAQAFLDLGLDIGVTGWITDVARGGAVRDALLHIPLDRLHIETDAPYLRPKNAKNTRSYNEPALLPFVAKAVAEIKGIPVEDVKLQTATNSRRLFRI